ncbi:tyrosine-type recombinase/integrase [Lichenicoccus sp.]|uniref:tyrosine-type recombinase/integrase n=1 Tax=Lichenicoccus sp. TaxID=2781899 RepID=UPI003D0E3E9D
MGELARSDGTGALAVRFIALTAARSGEVRGASWSQIDLEAKVWTVPADRMKAGREHRVPLSAGAIDVLQLARERGDGSGHVFPGGRASRGLSDVAVSKALHLAAGTKAVTVHGLRSTFRDWVADATSHQPDVAEAALAHALGDAVRVAYQRGDLFEKRRVLMDDWAAFVAVSPPARR